MTNVPTVTDDELEARIRRSLDGWAITAPLSVDRADEIVTSSPPRSRPYVALAAAAVLLVIGLVTAGVLRGGDDDTTTFAGPADEPARIAMGSSGVRTMATDGGSLWVLSANDRTLYRIDSETQEVAESVEVGGYFEGLAVDDGIAWMTGYEPTRLVAFDTETAQVVHEIPLDFDPWGVELAFGSVWVPGGGRLTRVDPDTGAAAVFDLGRSTGFLSASEDTLWVTDPDGEALLEVDPTDGQIDGVVDLGARPRGIEVAPDGDVWVTLPDASEVVQIDPRSREVTTRTTVGRAPDSITFVGSEVWVTIRDDGTVARLDGEDGQVLSVHPAGTVPAGIVSAFGQVWVSLHQEAAVLMVDPSDPWAAMPPTTIDGVFPVERRGIDLRCRGNGDTTIVLVTDAMRESADLPTLEAELARRARVCTVARPSGEPEDPARLAPDVRAVLAANVPGPYVVVGSGFGGLAARDLAATWDDAQALVLVDTNTTVALDPDAADDPLVRPFAEYLAEVDELTVAVPSLVVTSDPDVPTDDPRVGPVDARQAWFRNQQRLAEALDAQLLMIEGDPWVPSEGAGVLADAILDLALDR